MPESRFAIGQRVRIKFGIDRGKYATVIHVGGDDGTYYGIHLEGRDIGYCEHELDEERTAGGAE